MQVYASSQDLIMTIREEESQMDLPYSAVYIYMPGSLYRSLRSYVL